MNKGDDISVNLERGEATNLSTGEILYGDRLSSHVMEIIEKGGIIPMIREKLGRE